MRYSREELLGRDIDWFAVDSGGRIGHFTSNGTLLIPAPILSQKDVNESLTDELVEIPEIEGASRYDQSAEDWEPWLKTASNLQKTAFIEASLEWSNRGFFSYDCLREDPRGYFRISVPKNPVLIKSFALRLQVVIQRITLPVSFFESKELPSSLILDPTDQ